MLNWVEHEKSFISLWPGDLVFNPKWPSFELDLDFTEANILSKFQNDWVKTVTSSVIKLIVDDRQMVITIAHTEQLLRWAKK